MKIILLVMALSAVTAAAPQSAEIHGISGLNSLGSEALNERFSLVDILLQQLFEFIRWTIKNGWPEYDIPILDPLDLDNFHLVLPSGIINLDLDLEKIHATGCSQFVVHKSDFNGDEISLDIDISFPLLYISSEKYNLIGDFFTALPLYGSGESKFVVGEFNLQTKLYLKQSENGKSTLIDKIENTSFKVSSFKADLTGVIGGGDIDKIVNEMIEEVILDYVNRFQGAIGLVAANLVQTTLNPFFDQLDSWKYVALVLPAKQ